MVRFAAYIDGEKTQEGDLLPGEYIAGRSRSADIHLTLPDISGKHLKLEVRENAVFAENLSSHGTTLRGVALAAKTELADGDKLEMGKHLVFEIQISGGKPAADAGKTRIPAAPANGDPDKTQIPAAAPANEDPDRTMIPGAAPAAAPPPAQAPAPAKPAEDVPDVQKTDIMHTRLASLEEMDHLRNADRKRSAGKTLKYLLVAVAAITALVLLYSLKTAPKEETLTWPVDQNGRELGAFYDPGVGGHREAGAFSLAFPSIPNVTSIDAAKDGRITIVTRCGRDASVPLRILFVSRQSQDFLTQDRKRVFVGMLSELQKDNQRWSLGLISEVFFIGAENGLPCLSVSYKREVDQQSWNGEILFFRTGDRAYMRLAEIPAAEQSRGQNFISNIPFLKFSPKYIQGHWEGSSEYRFDGDVTAMMNEISRHLSKQAPFEWADTGRLLRNTLMESVRRGDKTLAENADRQLRRLRAMQAVWYNTQKLEYNKADLNNDENQKKKVMELCKMVFTSPDDQRCRSLRRNIWD